MNFMLVIISAMVSSIFLIYILCKNYNKEIILEHEVRPQSWIFVHTTVFLVTIMAMLVVDWVYLIVRNCSSGINRTEEVVYLVIQNGGLICIVMLLTSITYNYYIRLSEYEYFVQRHSWVKKLFFSIICISLIIMYVREIKTSTDIEGIVSDYNQIIVIWCIVLLQIWIGFGMNTYKPHDIICAISQELQIIKKKDEKRNLAYCVLSMLGAPFITIAYCFISENIKVKVYDVAIEVSIGVIIGASLSIVTLFYWNWKYRPNRRVSSKRYQKKFCSITEEYSTEYYLGVRYRMARIGDEYHLNIMGQRINIVKEESFNEKYLAELKVAFEEEELKISLQKHTKEKIYELMEKKLSSRADERKRLLSEGWNIVYEACKEKEHRLIMQNG